MKKKKKQKSAFSMEHFPVILSEEPEGGYTVINPSLEGCYSQGDTIEEALENIREATELCLEDLEETSFAKPSFKNVSLHVITVSKPYAKTSRSVRQRAH